MAAISLEEKELISLFRKELDDLKLYDNSDMFLVRWIRARENNLPQAEDMLRKHLDWWHQNDIDAVHLWPRPSWLTKFPLQIVGRDADNCPVVMIKSGQWDMKYVYNQNYRTDFIISSFQLNMSLMDMMDGYVTREGVPVTQTVQIMDFEGFSLRQLASFGGLQIMMDVGNLTEANFPETKKSVYVINASRLFSVAYELFKPIIPAKTQKCVTVFDSDKSKWMPALQKAIPLDILPVEYGGRNEINFGENIGPFPN